MLYKDYFSADAAAYAHFRPSYPGELFEFLASCAPRHDSAWDCATGNGQAAVGLAPHFTSVIATDASESQIAEATPHPRITYRVAAAESSGLVAHSADLITVAQALHWFNLEVFFAEVRRVAARNGVLAVWCYGMVRITPEIDCVLHEFYSETVGPYWPPGRELVDAGYGDIEFPFVDLPVRPFYIEKHLTLPELTGYLRTWSATRRYIQALGTDPVGPVVAKLHEHWGDPDKRYTARWRLHVRAGQVGRDHE